MRATRLILMGAIYLLGAAAATAASERASSPVTLVGASQFDLASKISARKYRIFVYKPLTPPPASGYPVIYVTDGNAMFPLASAQMALMGLAGKGALVVGIGYPHDDFTRWISLRYKDLTPVTEDQSLFPHDPPLGEADRGGQSELFYRFLVEELRPVLSSDYPVNAHEQTLYGHSLGGLFVLGVLFNHPDAFDRYVASSPSIWWDNRSVLKGEPAFAARETSAKTPLRVLICVGSKEQDAYTSAPPGQPMTLSEINKTVSAARMVANARDLANRLMRIDAKPALVVRFQDFSAEDHLSVVPASISRALQFAVEP